MHHNSNDADGFLEVQRESACRRLGHTTPRCANPRCNETDPLALTGTHPQILCHECLAQLDGRTTVEEHHPAGQHNLPSVTLPVPLNDHRVLSSAQAQWPLRTLRNPDGSPLLAAAAAIRGWSDLLRVAIERALGWIPEALERLDEHLVEVLGIKWWLGLDLGDASARLGVGR